jgi:phosphate acetyltransferase
MDLLTTIKNKAKSTQQRILLPESSDIRVIQAAREITDQKVAKIALVGNQDEVAKKASEAKVDLTGIEIIDPAKCPQHDHYVQTLYEVRKAKGMTLEKAAELIKNPLYFGTLMVYNGDMDGMVAGSLSTTGDVLRPALQIIKTKKPFKTVSGAFLMSVPNCTLGNEGVFVFADCAVNIAPDAQTLAEIGIQAAHTAKALGNFEPVIGYLSFSTKGSAQHEWVDKVVEATKLAKGLDSSLEIDGEFQADAALIESVGRQKAPGSTVAGRANVLIFPDIQSGNIGYKLVQRLGNASATGPILQGLAKPVNDLSRGCNVNDIVNMVAITSVQASQQ